MVVHKAGIADIFQPYKSKGLRFVGLLDWLPIDCLLFLLYLSEVAHIGITFFGFEGSSLRIAKSTWLGLRHGWVDGWFLGFGCVLAGVGIFISLLIFFIRIAFDFGEHAWEFVGAGEVGKVGGGGDRFDFFGEWGCAIMVIIDLGSKIFIFADRSAVLLAIGSPASGHVEAIDHTHF